MKTFNNIEEIFETAEFKFLYDYEKEVQELAEAGWTMDMVRSFAKSMAKSMAKKK